MAEFTPGPWEYHQDSYGRWWINDKTPYWDNGDEIMVVRTLSTEAEANARLIAAAPEMYEALQKLLDHNATGLLDLTDWDLTIVKNAIALVDDNER